jgi:uncharacterized protein
MEVSFDPAKDERNRLERGLSFERAREFDFDTAWFRVDDRRPYSETRTIAVGYLYKRLHVLCFVRTETVIRVISFRRANEREARQYAKEKAVD